LAASAPHDATTGRDYFIRRFHLDDQITLTQATIAVE
jgi:hypothetical protein